MATWKDGAAYAPIERPDGFATPEVEPLEAAVPQLADTPGPMPPPVAMQPTGDAVPLEDITLAPASPRNPTEPFDVASAMLTAGNPPSGKRDPRTPFQGLGPPTPETLPPPSGPPLEAPAALSAMPPPPVAPPAAMQPKPPGHGYTFSAPTQSAGVPQRQQHQGRQQLQYLATGLLAVGLAWWAATPLLLIAAGGLLFRVPHQKNAAVMALVAGAVMALMWLGDPRAFGAYGALACIIGLTMVLANWRPPADRRRGA